MANKVYFAQYSTQNILEIGGSWRAAGATNAYYYSTLLNPDNSDFFEDGRTIYIEVDGDTTYGTGSGIISFDTWYGGPTVTFNDIRPGDEGPYLRFSINSVEGEAPYLTVAGLVNEGETFDPNSYESIYLYYKEEGDPVVTASITLNATTGIATWSYSASSSEISFFAPYVQLWDQSDSVTGELEISDGSYDFSVYMSSGSQYYVTLKVGYNYGTSSSGEVTARSSTITYSPSSTGTSFAARMAAIREAICSKASISNEMMTIKTMIETLNGLSTYGSPNYDSYVNTDFNSSMTKLSKVIRSQNGTINSVSSLTIAQMPAAIALIELYDSGCGESCNESCGESCNESCGESCYQDENNPLTLTLTVYDNRGIEVNSNVYRYSEPYGTITWYGTNSGQLYQEYMYNGFDGAIYTVDESYVSPDGEYVYAEVTVSSDEGYSKTATSESFYVTGSGGCSGDEQCAQCSEDCGEGCGETDCSAYCQSCEGGCQDEQCECQTCEYGCQD